MKLGCGGVRLRAAVNDKDSGFLFSFLVNTVNSLLPRGHMIKRSQE